MTAPPVSDHWRRFRRLMGVTAIVALVTIVGGIFYVQSRGVPLRLHMVLAMSLGVGLSILLAGALMGLLFVSARSGHDESMTDERHDRDLP